ncbi:F0F1 ATP synthase subunit delta [Pallidibacillus pasinlerensis]|uniref:ATP synthase subunit delta n=1 Tax=Pallidibacillus pasinlerensis TaxID=2703818 RepID=A0ABX0A1V7_9BACI|nr:F0F1 ATP synthase subunit delta [Pallidibacillus pasinlerensis]NCU16290.1 F0F1 ATP synthase subunit delta [Pallidibacillus pasinlerensis]
MRDTVVANKYALALFQLAEENNLVDQIEEQLKVVKEVFNQEKDFESFLTSPKIGKDTKRELIKNAFGDLNPFILNTLLLLLDRQRVSYIMAVIDEFINISYESKGITKARVESVRPLKDEEKDALATVFAKKLDKNTLEIENTVNEDLLGGIKIQIGNRIYDGSLRGKLDGLKRELIG